MPLGVKRVREEWKILGPSNRNRRQTLTYPIVWSAIAALVIAGSIFACAERQPEGGLGSGGWHRRD